MVNKKVAFFTTHDDKSLELWRPNVTDIYYYSDEPLATYPQYDIVYFRDPFNDREHPTSLPKLSKVLASFFSSNPDIYSIDHTFDIADFFKDDKLYQYQCFGREYMPETMPATQTLFMSGKHVLKKRISCRCRDVFFEMPAIHPVLDDYIIQKREELIEEMRVFFIRGEVIRLAETRTSKTESSKVKALAPRELNDQEVRFIKEAMTKMPEMDFVGVDLAHTADGRMLIIEINKSPQFAGYYRLTGVNLAEKVF